jgi:hypothetical protein
VHPARPVLFDPVDPAPPPAVPPDAHGVRSEAPDLIPRPYLLPLLVRPPPSLAGEAGGRD